MYAPSLLFLVFLDGRNEYTTNTFVCLCGRQAVNLFEEELEIVRLHKWSDTCHH
jgi:hypothetical protein